MTSRLPDRNARGSSHGFTLIELILVIVLIAVVSGLIVLRLGPLAHFREEAYIRKLSETITFLHQQAVSDQAFYRLEFSLQGENGNCHHTYHVGVVRPEEEDTDTLAELCTSEVGNLSCELASFLSPSIGKTQTVIPPPAYPSLAEKIEVPEGVCFDDIRTMRGKKTAGEGGVSFVMFSPRGFSEFAVLHLTLSSGKKVTILINPFTGTTTIYREYRDFEWKYGRKESSMRS